MGGADFIAEVSKPCRSMRRPLCGLRPHNRRAGEVALHERNHELLVKDKKGPIIVVNQRESHDGTKDIIATLGYNGDIYIPEPIAEKIQCTFKINSAQTSVIICENSKNATTQCSTRGFSYLHRGGVLEHDIEKGRFQIITVGPVYDDHVAFEIIWYISSENPQKCSIAAWISKRFDVFRVKPSQEVRVLGQGTFGKVYSITDQRSKKVYALKVVPPRPTTVVTPAVRADIAAAKREGEILQKLKNDNIIEVYQFQEADNHIKLFMEPMPCSLKDLLVKGIPKGIPKERIPCLVYRSMLGALDYLDSQSIIHRDLKPSNILYNPQYEEKKAFKLADFGLCVEGHSATNVAGSLRYLAPEVCYGRPATHKADVWALFVTMLEVCNIGGYRKFLTSKIRENLHKIVQITRGEWTYLNHLQHAAATDPARRASAGEILWEKFGGQGSTRPRPDRPLTAPEVLPSLDMYRGARLINFRTGEQPYSKPATQPRARKPLPRSRGNPSPRDNDNPRPQEQRQPAPQEQRPPAPQEPAPQVQGQPSPRNKHKRAAQPLAGRKRARPESQDAVGPPAKVGRGLEETARRN